MRKVSEKMQAALDLMAQGYHIEYRIGANRNPFKLFRGEEKPIVIHTNTACGMITAGFVARGTPGVVEIMTLTDKGRAHAKVEAGNASA